MRPTTKTFLVCWLACHLVLSARGEAGPKEASFADENCALTPPAGWQPLEGINQPGVFAGFCNADRSRMVLLLVHQRGHPAAELNDAWIAAFDRGVTKAGGSERLSGKIVQVAGYPAYERRGTSGAKDHPRSMFMIAMPTGDGIYLLEGLSSTGDAGEDAEIRQTLATFHFLRSPGPPRSAAYWLGYLLGLVGIAVIVVLVTWLIARLLNRGRSNVPAAPSGPYPAGASFPPPPPPAAPPPLPPSGPSAPPPLPPGQ